MTVREKFEIRQTRHGDQQLAAEATGILGLEAVVIEEVHEYSLPLLRQMKREHNATALHFAGPINQI